MLRNVVRSGKDFSVELGSLKEWDCSAVSAALHTATAVIDSVKALLSGRAPDWFAMDEPLMSGMGPVASRRARSLNVSPAGSTVCR